MNRGTLTLDTDAGLTLTSEFQQALDLLDSGSHLFLTGKAGTGKSTLVRLFTQNRKKNLVVAAPTGVAALNVNGYTLHRLFSFRPGITPEFVRSDQYFPGRFHRTLQTLDTLVIDEASMVRSDLFDSIAAALSRFGPQPGQPFGGVQIVLVGDLYQLPPVVHENEETYFSTTYDSPFFFSAHSYDTNDFPTIELTTVFRQEGDPEFVAVLNAIRDGQATPETVDALNEHVNDKFVPDADEFWLTLTTRNNIADARNRTELDRLTTEPHTSTAHMTGALDNFEPPTQASLKFKVGAQIMLLTNDPQDRWVNGTLAVVIGVESEDGEYTVEIELRDKQRHKVQSHTWEITRPDPTNGVLTHEVIGAFRQLPFRLAWAITIHKAQGLTLNRCIVDLAGGTFADGQLYVALSRARSLDGLTLARPVRPRDLRVNQHIRRFLHTRTGGDDGEYVVLAAHFVGDDGWQWRPRPIELAVALPDGTELTTLIDPQRDLGDASTRLNITAEDVVLAPTLPLAWSVIAPYLDGHIPVGYDLAQTLEFLDYELKRHGHIMELPIGVELKPTASRTTVRKLDGAVTAVEKARIVRELLDTATEALPAATAFSTPATGFGYLLPRHDRDTARFVVAPEDHKDLAHYLSTLTAEAKNSERLSATLRAVETSTGHAVVATGHNLVRRTIDEVLQPGRTVCFTGDARHPSDGSPIERSKLERLAREFGLAPDTMTKSRTDALIVAEFGTQSGKARKARQWGKPIFSVEEFLAWANGTNQDAPAGPATSIEVVLDELPPRPPAATADDEEDDRSANPNIAADEPVVPQDEPLEKKLAQTEPGIPEVAELVIPWTAEDIGEFLTSGAGVSATGILYHPKSGNRIIQDDLARMLTEHDFQYVRNLTQRTTLLLVGELSKPTRQLATAIENHKPIFAVAEFFAWTERRRIEAAAEQPPIPKAAVAEQSHIPEPATAEEPQDEPPSPPPNAERPSQEAALLSQHWHQPAEPYYASQPPNTAHIPQQSASSKPGPFWKTMSTAKFYSLGVGIPLGLILMVPILLGIVAVGIPGWADALVSVGAVSMLIGLLALPVAVVLIALRIIGRRRHNRHYSLREQRNR